MPDRGVIYIVWGDAILPTLNRSRKSLGEHHPELPIHVEFLAPDSTLLDKSRMHRLTPFEETLFLDSDTIVMDRLDFGFEMAAKHGLALSICECPWARRYGGLSGDAVEYNTGVIFFTQTANHVFDAWDTCGREIDSSILFYNGSNLVRMPYNDQAGFAKAIIDTDFNPYVLPYNWNFRPHWHRSFWGPIKVWHDYSEPPADIVQWTNSQSGPGAIIQYADLGSRNAGAAQNR
jgi:hypothetical protein